MTNNKTLENQKYSFWELLQIVGIKIPIIQRDYAQGRENEKTESIREIFLNSLYDAIKKNKPLDLDFVYGTIKDDYLIPLDGQQRLTTLFLLHYYLALKDGLLNEENRKILSKFTYETRLSSREFCELLVNQKIKLSDDRILSSTIKNQTWFFSEWKNDSTIKGMLVMLDGIQAKFKNEEKLFDFINTETNDKTHITFSFLNLKDFKLTDELYIKMNARGKPLSDFENFKSKFEKFVSDENIKANLDNKWYDIFWNISKERIKEDKDKLNIADASKLSDKMFLNFFKNITPFFKYKKLKNINNIDIFDFSYNNYHIAIISKVLNCLINFKDTETDMVRENLYIFRNFLKENNAKDFSYADRLKFYILLVFFIKIGDIKNDLNKILFKSWLRVNINIINNSAYDNIEDFKNNVALIYKLSQYLDSKKNFYDELQKSSLLDSEEYKEEKLKAKIICDSQFDKLEDTFITAEKHWYLDGQIKFLIEFSKDENNGFVIGYFIRYFDRFNKLWKFAKKNMSNQTLLHRALSTYKDYLPQNGKSKKYTFCSFGTGLREKDQNWRKVFKDNDDFFKHLLDDIKTIDILKIKLKEIIDKYPINCKDFRSYYVNPEKDFEIISFAKNYQIYFKNKNEIFLNKGDTKATSWGWSRVAELYSYYLLKDIENQNIQILPFKESYYYENKERQKACAVIDGWKLEEKYNFAIDIKYKKINDASGYKFSMEFFDRKENNIPVNIIKILENNEFKESEQRYINRNFTLCQKDNLIKLLKKLIQEFKSLENDPI